MKRPRVTVGLALAALVAGAVPALAGSSLRAHWRPEAPRVGDVLFLEVSGTFRPGAALMGKLDSSPLTFFSYDGGHAALVGIDLAASPGRHEWRIEVREPGEPVRELRGQLPVAPRTFSVQRLTLPRAMVDLDPDTEQRAVAEGQRLRALYRTLTSERLWRGRFAHPLDGDELGGGFGAQRIINGQARAPHAGTDYPAPLGTPVLAANAGRVALVAEFFFPGRLVIIDHGLGLYTLYFHLDNVAVSEGAMVERRQSIGTVGASGRATGPHLHFGVQVGEARVDPDVLLGLGVAD